jgi:hypothetical protein
MKSDGRFKTARLLKNVNKFDNPMKPVARKPAKPAVIEEPKSRKLEFGKPHPPKPRIGENRKRGMFVSHLSDIVNEFTWM